jgi:hypothetical protein
MTSKLRIIFCRFCSLFFDVEVDDVAAVYVFVTNGLVPGTNQTSQVGMRSKTLRQGRRHCWSQSHLHHTPDTPISYLKTDDKRRDSDMVPAVFYFFGIMFIQAIGESGICCLGELLWVLPLGQARIYLHDLKLCLLNRLFMSLSTKHAVSC